MKKSLLALVVLGAFASAASAQSSVTIFGKIDQAVGKNIGTEDKSVMDNAGSRIAFRGYEDLGGGLGAIFAFEHRFTPDTGASTSTTTFWNGFSYVGLRSTLGTVTIGRQYTSAFLGVQNNIDPFAGETVAALRNIGTALAITTNVTPAAALPGKVRIGDSVKYSNTFSGFTISADIGEAATNGGGPDRPFSVAFSYAGGPLWAGVSYEDASGVNDDLINVGAKYTFGTFTLSAGVAEGHTNSDAKVRGYLVGANIAVGSGDIKAGYAQLKLGDTTVNSRVGLGYHHNLSKRTKLFVDVAREGKISDEKMGYDLGIQHAF